MGYSFASGSFLRQRKRNPKLKAYKREKKERKDDRTIPQSLKRDDADDDFYEKKSFNNGNFRSRSSERRRRIWRM